MTSRLRACGVHLAYEATEVVAGLDLDIADGEFVAVVGPNACGKSTLLRGLARLLRPTAGVVLLDGEDIHRLPTAAVARRLSMLPQAQVTPPGITVADLVARGRYAHQSFWRRWGAADAAAVAAAMELARVADLADQVVDELSGGQRQRVWLATVLAQQGGTLLLDEPTTYLDIAHQVEVLELCARLHAAGSTVVAVLHDLNQAAAFATRVVVMKAGAVVADGAPGEVLVPEVIEDVFGVRVRLLRDPVAGTDVIVPVRSGADAEGARS